MAPRFKTAPVGSSQWIQNEREQAGEFVDMEIEEFGFAASNEMEWLNEHMAEIFSGDQVNLADIFKTPGKLRGKTPRTVRKRELSTRAPLTDLFAPNPQSTFSPAAPKNDFYSKVAQFQIAQDVQEQAPRQGTSRRSPLRVGKENTDSGYHGMTEDEMDADSQQSLIKFSHAQPPAPELVPVEENVQHEDAAAAANDNDSFVSANEDLDKAGENAPDDDQATVPDDSASSRPVSRDSNTSSRPISADSNDSFAHGNTMISENWQVEEQNDRDMANEADLDQDEAKSPSDASTPDKPLVRKSSLTFAALPAREPLTAKRSLGTRNSHLDAFAGRNSTLGKSLGVSQQNNSQPAEEAPDHSKTSTQRLHDRITLLGQQKEPRTEKSFPMPAYPHLPTHENETANEAPTSQPFAGDTQPLGDDDDDDDWIAPIKSNSRPASGVDTEKPAEPHSGPAEPVRTEYPDIPRSALRESPSKYYMGHHKSSSTATLASPAKVATSTHHAHHKTTSVSNPNFVPNSAMSTPLASPNKQKFADAPISASKAKLYSVLKSAKGMFGSSAAASAQAKMDSFTSPRPLSAATFERPDLDVSRMPSSLYPDLSERPATALASTAEGRKTRSSTENERKRGKDTKEDQSVMDGLEKVRQKERQRATEQKEQREKIIELARQEKERLAAASRPGAESQQSYRSTADEQSEADDMAPPVPAKNSLPAGKLRAPGRLARPTKITANQPKPAPVSIKVASQSSRLGPAQSTTSSQETIPTQATTRPTATRSGSAQPPASSKSAPTASARVRALDAAARKKEQDEKQAQRKAEQKREIERKRAAKAEEERKAEQERKVAEQQRLQESRVAAQKQAEQRKLEQQRQVAQQKKGAELAAALEQERQEKQQTLPRGDIGGTLRQLAKQERPVPQANTAKPAKRPLQQEDTLPRAPASYQQQDNKRRRTQEGEEDVDERPSVMAPPKRPSSMRKDTFNKFPNGYTHAPPPAAHHLQNMFKATVTAQHQLQHGAKPGMHPNDMMKLSTARIPFAENSNPSGASQSSQEGASSSRPPSAFKTPGRPASQVVSKKSAAKHKSSPMYPNGDNINLPEIATDSEDEDSEDDQTGGFRAPSWVASPALRELLTQQQLVDPESVFGPIAPLQMDEVFRNGKNQDRLKKFRDRGSSARWVETGDAVTKEEKVKDREMRAKVVKEGGWRYGQDA